MQTCDSQYGFKERPVTELIIYRLKEIITISFVLPF